MPCVAREMEMFRIFTRALEPDHRQVNTPTCVHVSGINNDEDGGNSSSKYAISFSIDNKAMSFYFVPTPFLGK